MRLIQVPTTHATTRFVNQGSIKAQELTLTNGGQISSTVGGFTPDGQPIGEAATGDGGILIVSVTGTVSMSGSAPTGESGLFANTTGKGDSGDIVVHAAKLDIGDGGAISAISADTVAAMLETSELAF